MNICSSSRLTSLQPGGPRTTNEPLRRVGISAILALLLVVLGPPGYLPRGEGD
jgi:hypothetical protein